jgi:hypothetical protein
MITKMDRARGVTFAAELRYLVSKEHDFVFSIAVFRVLEVLVVVGCDVAPRRVLVSSSLGAVP